MTMKSTTTAAAATANVKRYHTYYQEKEDRRRQTTTATATNPYYSTIKTSNPTTTTCTTTTINKNATTANTTTNPFDIETTLTFEAIEHWAKVDPHRTALIYADTQWKVEHGKLAEPRSVDDEDAGDSEWKTMTYKEFLHRVNRFRAALHHAGVPLPSSADVDGKKTKRREPFRILLLYAPPSRADVLALIIAMQAAGCVFLFGTPEAFGGIRNFIETMLQLEPDAVLCNRMVYAVFRSICMTISGSSSSSSKKNNKSNKQKKPIMWLKSTILSKVAPKLDEQQIAQYTATTTTRSTTTPSSTSSNSSITSSTSTSSNMKEDNQNNNHRISLDTVATIMFSSGTTGPPTPIEVTHRMLCFQAAGYAQLLQTHFGKGVIRDHTTITGMIGHDYQAVTKSQRMGPWISTHIFINFVMLDLVLGGTAVMQPMGLNSPDTTVCAETLYHIWCHFQTQVTSAPPALWKRLLQRQKQQQRRNHRGQQRTTTMNRNSNNNPAEIASSSTTTTTTSTKKVVDSIRIAFVGGAETSNTFARDLAREFLYQSPTTTAMTSHHHPKNGGGVGGGGLYRVYGTTQVLPIALATDVDIARSGLSCARGLGVCLGPTVDGLEVSIDTAVWESQGGRSRLSTAIIPGAGVSSSKAIGGGYCGSSVVNIGELCVTGTAVSSSMEEVITIDDNKDPTTNADGSGGNGGTPIIRKFRSGDICYVEPETSHLYFLGRMSQAVDCGDEMGLVPPVGIEMVCLETQLIDHCAFVGFPSRKGGAAVAVLVVQLVDRHQSHSSSKETTTGSSRQIELEFVSKTIRLAFEKSIWSPLLNTKLLRLVVYPKAWPVDVRHSSKTNRVLLRDWAAKLDSSKFQYI